MTSASENKRLDIAHEIRDIEHKASREQFSSVKTTLRDTAGDAWMRGVVTGILLMALLYALALSL